MPDVFGTVLFVVALLIGLVSIVLAGRSVRVCVVRVLDGDTLVVRRMSDRQTFRVRLYGVDCPETDQPGGKEAARFVRNWVKLNPDLRLLREGTDHYGRAVGRLLSGKRCLSEDLVRAGHAWVYGPYCRFPDRVRWAGLERRARRARLGLWRDPNPVAPWEWRRRKRTPFLLRVFGLF